MREPNFNILHKTKYLSAIPRLTSPISFVSSSDLPFFSSMHLSFPLRIFLRPLPLVLLAVSQTQDLLYLACHQVLLTKSSVVSRMLGPYM